MSGVKAKGSKPWWWKPLWIAILLTTIASGVFGYFLLHVPLERMTGLVALTFLCIGIAYYSRVRPSMKVNRGIYILFGVTPIGFGLWILYALSGIGRFLNTHLDPFLSFIVAFITPYVMGAFIGDWIGRRRNYRLPLSP
ncbi:MAG: hypothetical protein OEZ29_07135 [Candidatus Bathyarchaeota archaeon]|nr:hypothetical protein [Candidatus Bathyarchaeota archaeon]